MGLSFPAFSFSSAAAYKYYNVYSFFITIEIFLLRFLLLFYTIFIITAKNMKNQWYFIEYEQQRLLHDSSLCYSEKVTQISLRTSKENPYQYKSEAGFGEANMVIKCITTPRSIGFWLKISSLLSSTKSGKVGNSLPQRQDVHVRNWREQITLLPFLGRLFKLCSSCWP